MLTGALLIRWQEIPILMSCRFSVGCLQSRFHKDNLVDLGTLSHVSPKASDSTAGVGIHRISACDRTLYICDSKLVVPDRVWERRP